MKPKRYFLVFTIFFLLSGCVDHEKILSEEQVISLVKEEFGDVTIDHIIHQGNRYYIRYRKPSNCESGSIQMDDKTGEALDGQASIC